jgi:hypothetical protein
MKTLIANPFFTKDDAPILEFSGKDSKKIEYKLFSEC